LLYISPVGFFLKCGEFPVTLNNSTYLPFSGRLPGGWGGGGGDYRFYKMFSFCTSPNLKGPKQPGL
jgi:hypothetical protein